MTLIKIEQNKVFYRNGVLLGDIEVGEDGYYVYWPILKAGYWTAEPMREIADYLDEMNKDWDKQVQDWDKQVQEGLSINDTTGS